MHLGLDSAVSSDLMGSIQVLAAQQRTIVCTIHQPSPHTFAYFHKLMVLSAGRCVYYGSTSDVVDYFSTSVYQFPYVKGSNIADYVIAISGSFCNSSDGLKVNASQLSEHYDKSDYYAKLCSVLHDTVGHLDDTSVTKRDASAEATDGQTYITSTSNQIAVLCKRRLLNTVKGPIPVISETARSSYIYIYIYISDMYCALKLILLLCTCYITYM